ncbi:TRASH domain-containing protein [Lactobacillus crispatus]|uniref:TRASH domain-containing protein n=1 Tax=Lactobacillus crispatus TaxID=47770 RepID=A0ABV2BC56_9LACO|nr:TRASH domain-containing protein [Lactobacillus crispatus]UAY39845.1 TRASH domain-containing protein [Lactobacillus crispatus]UAY49761.1 TRASH domain-containing protein [Lactobacillus crispatus]
MIYFGSSKYFICCSTCLDHLRSALSPAKDLGAFVPSG